MVLWLVSTRNFQAAVWFSLPVICKQCLGQLSLLPSVGQEMSSRLRAMKAVWLILAVVWLLSANRGSPDTNNGWPHSALRYHLPIPISCHFRDCQSACGHESDLRKKRYSMYQTCTFTFYFFRFCRNLGCNRRCRFLGPGSTWYAAST